MLLGLFFWYVILLNHRFESAKINYKLCNPLSLIAMRVTTKTNKPKIVSYIDLLSTRPNLRVATVNIVATTDPSEFIGRVTCEKAIVFFTPILLFRCSNIYYPAQNTTCMNTTKKIENTRIHLCVKDTRMIRAMLLNKFILAMCLLYKISPIWDLHSVFLNFLLLMHIVDVSYMYKTKLLFY